MALLRTQIFPSTSKIRPKGDVENEVQKKYLTAISDWADKLIRVLDDLIKKIAAIPFNRSESLEVTDTGNADTTFTKAHHLGRMPAGYIVSFIDKAAVVYCDSTDFGNWSTTEIKLKCNVANVSIKLCVF